MNAASEKTRKGYGALNYVETYRMMLRCIIAILIIWSVSPVAESNSLVLNEAAARLGQSLRETEDQLIRDMLAGTASVVNCVNGVNGDNPRLLSLKGLCGIVKSLLIDLEVLQQGDRAQATERCAA